MLGAVLGVGVVVGVGVDEMAVVEGAVLGVGVVVGVGVDEMAVVEGAVLGVGVVVRLGVDVVVVEAVGAGPVQFVTAAAPPEPHVKVPFAVEHTVPSD